MVSPDLFLPAIVGAIAGLLASLVNSWFQNRARRALEFAHEYLSCDFIMHRNALYRLGQSVADDSIQEATVRTVAGSLWFPGIDGGYQGEELDGLSLHQHLEVALGWYRRVGYAVKKRQVDTKSLSSQLGGSLDWSAWLIRELCEEVELQAGRTSPEWTRWVRLAQDTLVVNPRAFDGSALMLRSEGA